MSQTMLSRSPLLDIPVRQRNIEVFVHGQRVEQVIALKNEADVPLLNLEAVLLAQLVNGMIAEVVLAGPRGIVHAEHVQQRRLAGARRSHDGDELSFADIETDAPEHECLRRAVLKVLLDVAKRNHDWSQFYYYRAYHSLRSWL